MEGKERFELFGEHCIKDNDSNVPCQLLDAYKACVILNEQDKEIKHLKRMLQLEEDQKKFIHEEWNTYVRQLNKAKDKDSVIASKQLAIDKMTELYNLADEIYHSNDMDKEWLLDWLKAEIWKLNQEIKSLKGDSK